jgi:hypothetical protein
MVGKARSFVAHLASGQALKCLAFSCRCGLYRSMTSARGGLALLAAGVLAVAVGAAPAQAQVGCKARNEISGTAFNTRTVTCPTMTSAGWAEPSRAMDARSPSRHCRATAAATAYRPPCSTWSATSSTRRQQVPVVEPQTGRRESGRDVRGIRADRHRGGGGRSDQGTFHRRRGRRGQQRERRSQVLRSQHDEAGPRQRRQHGRRPLPPEPFRRSRTGRAQASHGRRRRVLPASIADTEPSTSLPAIRGAVLGTAARFSAQIGPCRPDSAHSWFGQYGCK